MSLKVEALLRDPCGSAREEDGDEELEGGRLELDHDPTPLSRSPCLGGIFREHQTAVAINPNTVSRGSRPESHPEARGEGAGTDGAGSLMPLGLSG